MESQLGVQITRDVRVCTHPFLDFFKGFERVEVVRRIFGEKTDEVLGNLRVEFMGTRGYMGVSNEDGHLLVGALYLKSGDFVELYLDVIHELVHVRQKVLEGKELFDDRFSYVERPTELEAYRFAVDEAKRLGMSDERIVNYLSTEWMNKRELRRLAEAMGLNCDCLCVKRARPRKK